MKNKYLLLIFVSTLFLLTFNITNSRYIGELKSNNDVIAIPILSLSSNKLIINLDSMIPGETREYDFFVTNKENDKINEILLNYKFIITADNNIPLNFKIYEQDNNRELTMTANQTSEESITYNVETIKKYKIQIIWDEKNNSYTLANKNTSINIELVATQVA